MLNSLIYINKHIQYAYKKTTQIQREEIIKVSKRFMHHAHKVVQATHKGQLSISKTSTDKIIQEGAKAIENKLPSTSSTTSNISSAQNPCYSPSSNIHKPTMYSKTSNSQQSYIEKEHQRGQKLFNSFTETPIIPGISPSLIKDKHYEASRESEPAMLQKSSQIQDIKPILKQAEEQKLIKYEDTKEYTASGAVKLSAEGFKRFNKLLSNITTTSAITSSDAPPPQITYEVGTLTIHSDTAIPLPIQMHLVVVYDQTNNSYRGIGVLTSEKNPLNIKLSDTQPISDNMNKMQYIKPLEVPLSITREQFHLHKKGTEYVQEPEIVIILNKIRNKIHQSITKVYDTKGTTIDDLKKIVEVQVQEKQQSLPIVEQESNFLKEALQAKKFKKQEKAELNKIKQKQQAEQEKLKQQKDENTKKQKTTNIETHDI